MAGDRLTHEPRGIAVVLLLASVAVYLVLSAALAGVGLDTPIATVWTLMLGKVSAAACVGAYGLGALWLRTRGRSAWRVATSVLIVGWTAVNLAVWTPAAFRLGEPVACAAPTRVARVEMPDPCRHCDAGDAPAWWCLLIGCW